MPKFVIERTIPDVGSLSGEQFQAIAHKSCDVIRGMGPQVQWVESFVTNDKIYCIYNAPSAEAVREHARRGEFPADAVNEVRRIIDPTTEESK